MSEPELIRIRHLSSNAFTEVKFLGFDGKKKTVLLRYGLSGIYDFSLDSGQGKDDARCWAIDHQLDDLRKLATKRGIDPGIKREPRVEHKRPVRKTRKRKAESTVHPRQASLFGGE